MPHYTPPGNDIARLTFLQRSAVTGATDAAAKNDYLGPETLTEVAQLAADFENALDNISDTGRERSQEVLQRQEAVATLATYVRDLWEVLRRRVRRQNEPASVLLFYQLPLDGTTPYPSQPQEWLAIAADVVRGDAEAVAAGFAPMSNPSAAELDAVLTTARAESGEADAADRVFDQAQEALADLRAQADQMIQDIMAELRFTLRRKDAPSQRRIMRTYGATYAYLEGEPRDADDQQDEPGG